jgi:hypothetical protein
MKHTIIQDTWTEDDDIDLLDYVKKNNIDTKFLSEGEILNTDLSKINVLFSDTDIVQKMINPQCVPNCYPNVFKELYDREIKIVKVKDLLNLDKPFFVKPLENDKSFEAHIIKTNYDIQFMVDDFKEKNINDDDNVYYSSLVNFVNEYRLFIGHKKLYGMVESTELLIDPSKAKSVVPSQEFINKVLQINPYDFCVIDIGCVSDSTHDKWSIVEVNPSFALTSYDWNIEKYYKYCEDAWIYYVSKSV